MTEESLKNKIKELRSELDRVADDDPESRERLDQLISELEEKLENQEEYPSLIDSIKESINHFEAEHPRATAIMNDIMVTLSNMGI